MLRLPQRVVTKVLAVLTAGLALGIIGIGAWHVFGRPEPEPWSKPAAIDGATVRLTYYGSRCRDSADVDVDENSTRVVITIRETVRGRSCDSIAILYDVVVRLNAPLADRVLVDGACQISTVTNHSECGPTKPTVKPGRP